jgi:hypothetical protein
VLVMSEEMLNIDAKRVEMNVQLQTLEKCRSHDCICSGCGQRIINEPRFICMGCRREPMQSNNYIDFCIKCQKELMESEQSAKNKIIERLKKQGGD